MLTRACKLVRKAAARFQLDVTIDTFHVRRTSSSFIHVNIRTYWQAEIVQGLGHASKAVVLVTLEVISPAAMTTTYADKLVRTYLQLLR